MKYPIVTVTVVMLLCAPLAQAELPSSSNAESMTSDTISIERITVHGHTSQQSDLLIQPIAASFSPDARKQLDAEPGISINSNGVITGVIQHRGLFGDRLHVSHQGASVFGAGPNSMDSPLSHVISAAAPVATIYRGISPVSAGYESIGGAVQFNDAEWLLSANAELQYRGMLGAHAADNGNQQQYSGFGEVASQQWGVRLSGQYQTADDYEDAKGQQVNNTRYDRLLGSLAGVWRQGGQEITYAISHNQTNHSGTPALAMDIEYIDATWYRLQYQHELNDASLRLRAFGNNNRHDMSNFAMRSTMAPMQRRNTVSSDVFGVALEYDAEWHIQSLPINFKSGLEWHSREHQSVINNPTNAAFFINNFNNVQRDMLTMFAELNWRGENGYFATMGLRPTQVRLDADVVGSNMAMMNPNVALLVSEFNQSDRDQSRQWLDAVVQLGRELGQYWTVHGSIAQKGRGPSYHELYTWFPLGITGGLADGRNYIGDINLREEVATQLELGIDYQQGNFLVQPRIFWYDIKDYINGVPANNLPANQIAMMMGVLPPLQWSNIDAELWGGDVSVLFKLSELWQLDASFEWLRGTDTRLEQPLYRLAPRRADLTLRYEANDWSGFATVVIVDSQDKVSSLQNEPSTAGYATFDSGVSYMLSSGLSASLIVNNLFDRDYVHHLGGINRVANASTPLGERLPEMGRTIGLTLNYRF